MTTISEKYVRQLGIYNPEGRRDSVTFIGVGGIGSFAAFGAAKLGIPNITLIDPDLVEIHNQPNQFYGTGDVGETKVAALAGHILADRDTEHGEVNIHEGSMLGTESDYQVSGVVVSGLDSMEARSNVWNSIRLNPAVPLYLDARLSGEFIALYAVNPTNMEDIDGYEKTLYSDDSAEELMCTERGIIDVGLQVGSMIVRALRRHFNHEEVDRITLVNQNKLTATRGTWIPEARP